MNGESLGRLFLRHLVIGSSWGIVFLVVVFVAALGLKQQIKEGIQYSFRSAMYEASDAVRDPNLVQPVKQNIKEGVEFVAQTWKKEVRSLLGDPEVVQGWKRINEEISGSK